MNDAMSGEWTAAGPAQARFWFVHELSEGDPAAHLAVCWQLDGPVDQHCLEAAFGDVVRRHQALRTAYALHDGRVMQRVVPAATALEDLGSAATSDEALRICDQFGRRPFDLAAGRVWRAGLVAERASGTVLFIFVVHHIAFDGWSEHVFAKELAQSFAARAAGRAPDLGPEPMQPAEHAARLLDEAARADDARAFWANELAGLQPMPLPRPDHRSSGEAPGRGAEPGGGQSGSFTALPIEARAMAAVENLATHARTSPFTVFLAAYVRVLSQLLDIDDLCVGVPFLGRDDLRAEGSIGCYVEPLPVRVRTDRSGTFDATLTDVRSTLLRMLDRTALPFDEIVKVSRTRRSRRHPLFQTMFAFQQTPEPQLRLADRRGAFIRLHPSASMFEVTAEVWALPDGTGRLTLLWQPDHVEPRFVERLRDGFEQQLESVLPIG